MILNALTVDVEEHFHASEIQSSCGIRTWQALPSRVVLQTEFVLEMLARHQVKATFFVLGWVAERCPGLVRNIAAAGHEIACHSYAHRLVYEMTPDEFEADTRLAEQAIEAACGVRPRIYRAPSYSITGKSMWALAILARRGFTHDSSIYPIAHDRYGIPGFERHCHTIETEAGAIVEIPAATVRLSKQRTAPVGGGGYLRLLPYRYTAAGLRRINGKELQPACIYFHPWELDPELPRFGTGLLSRLRTYSGLRSMSRKIERLLTEFEFSTVSQVYGCRQPEARLTALSSS